MTVLDATHKLFDYFSDKHTYCASKNFKDLVPISENLELEMATVRLALQDMEKNEIIRCTAIDDEEFYILNRPLESFEQSVSISFPTAIMISQAMNEFCNTIEDYTDIVDTGNVTEKDIRNLVILNQHHKAEMTKLMQEDSNGGFNLDNI